MASACEIRSVVERLDEFALAEHEGIGDMAQRRQIDIRLAGLDEFGKTAVERRIFGFRCREC